LFAHVTDPTAAFLTRHVCVREEIFVDLDLLYVTYFVFCATFQERALTGKPCQTLCLFTKGHNGTSSEEQQTNFQDIISFHRNNMASTPGTISDTQP
jgi:hypothetical protein